MKRVATYFNYIVFHDFWNTYHHMGFANHNAMDRRCCFDRMVEKYRSGEMEEDFSRAEKFYKEHSEGGNSEIADQAHWTVGRYSDLVDALSDAETIEDFDKWLVEWEKS